jgi:hypothetical protein
MARENRSWGYNRIVDAVAKRHGEGGAHAYGQSPFGYGMAPFDVDNGSALIKRLVT